MTTFDRRQLILDLVRQNGSVTVQSLIEAVNTSPATLRRDLSALETEGKVIRTHGGVLHPRRLSTEPSFSVKQQQAPAEKRHIARKAAESIPAGATVFIDAGTTCLETGMALLERNKNQIYTNSLPLLYLGCNHPGKVTALGGEVRSISRALVGGIALGWLEHLNFDYAVIGASSLDADAGAFTTELNEAQLKSQAIQHSEIALLVADSGKLSSNAPVKFAKWQDFDHWFTDKRLSPSTKRRIRKSLPVTTISTSD